MRLPVLPACTIACITALAGCGGGSSSSGGDSGSAQTILKQTFSSSESTRSGRLDLGLTLATKGLPGVQGPVSLTLKGPYENRGPKQVPELDLDVALKAGGQGLTAGLISTGKQAFVKVQGTAYALSPASFKSLQDSFARSPGTGASGSGSGTTLGALGVDPSRWVVDPVKAGTEELGGARTDHVRAGVDLPKMLADANRLLSRASGASSSVPSALSLKQLSSIRAAVKDADMDVWSAQKGHGLRRLRVTVDFAVPKAQQASLNGLRAGTLIFQLGLSDLGEEQPITAPPSSRPASDLSGLLRGLTGSAAGATTPQTTTTPPAGSSDYTQCAEAAGSDVTELQACAPLLGG